jgi:hypothetical protein
MLNGQHQEETFDTEYTIVISNLRGTGFSLCGFDFCGIQQKSHRLKPVLPVLGMMVTDSSIASHQLDRVFAAQFANGLDQILVRAHALVGLQRSNRALGRNQIEGDGAGTRLARKKFF